MIAQPEFITQADVDAAIARGAPEEESGSA
jgi:hypothetical protein